LLLQTGLSSADGRRRAAALLSRLPGTRTLVATRQRAGWTRIMSFGIGAGVGLLGSTRLAMDSVPDGRLRAALGRSVRDIRAGKPVAEAMTDPLLLGPMDLSLLRVGQRTGTLSQMFATISDYHEEILLERLKRATVVVEQLAIALVASAIGLIVISLVGAMTSVYESIG
jgi:type II secretory pathway component PulF